MPDKRIVGDNVCGEAFEGCVEIGYPVLREQANEIQTTNGIFALGRWKLRANNLLEKD